MQSGYRSEESTKKLCYYYERKYKTRGLRPDVPFADHDNWFEVQLDIGNYLGVHYSQLYRKDLDLDSLFKEAHRVHELRKRLEKPKDATL